MLEEDVFLGCNCNLKKKNVLLHLTDFVACGLCFGKHLDFCQCFSVNPVLASFISLML